MYSQHSVLRNRNPDSAVDRHQDEGDAPPQREEPLHGDLVPDEHDHQRQMQVQPLAEHPHVVGEHEILKQYVQRLTPHLKNASLIAEGGKRGGGVMRVFS